MLKPISTFLARPCDAPQRFCPDDPKRLTRSWRCSAVGETRKLAAILVSDVVGYSRLAGADEDRTSRGSGRCAAT
jgi:class 3 adenylate cyclase